MVLTVDGIVFFLRLQLAQHPVREITTLADQIAKSWLHYDAPDHEQPTDITASKLLHQTGGRHLSPPCSSDRGPGIPANNHELHWLAAQLLPAHHNEALPVAQQFQTTPAWGYHYLKLKKNKLNLVRFAG